MTKHFLHPPPLTLVLSFLLQACSLVINAPSTSVAPTVTSQALTMIEGHGKTLSSSDLYATAGDAPANQVQFTISSSSSGAAIFKNETQLATGDTFTQADINSGLISFRHTSSSSATTETVTLAASTTGSATSTSVTLSADFTQFSDWTQNLDNGATGMNNNAAMDAGRSSLIKFQNKLYAGWPEIDASNYNIHVSVFTGTYTSPAWTPVDNGSLNFNNLALASEVRFETVNSKLYAITEEEIAGIGNIRVQVYNGNDSAPGWTFVDGGSLNFNSTLQAGAAQTAVLNDKLYVLWRETTGASAFKIRIKVYNGNDGAPSWADVSGDAGAGLNKNATRTAFFPSLTVFNGKLYAAWPENDGSSIKQLYVKVYNGDDFSPTWTAVDGLGLNIDPLRQANRPSLAASDTRLFIIWHEFNASSVEQLRAKAYNGNDSSPSWTDITGGSAAAGLNYDSAQSVGIPDAAVYGMGSGRLYVTWPEATATVDQIRVKMFNGNISSPSWTFVDGNTATGVNKTTTLDANTPKFTVIEQSLYLAWPEDSNGGLTDYQSMIVRAQ